MKYQAFLSIYMDMAQTEAALVNSLAAAFHNSKGLLCYIHITKNISLKLQKLGLSGSLREEICRDIFSKPRGLLWEESSQFLERASTLMMKWDDLEGKERRGSQQFSPYFKKEYLEEQDSFVCNAGAGPWRRSILSKYPRVR